MIEHLKTSVARRLTFVISALLLVVILSVRIWLLPKVMGAPRPELWVYVDDVLKTMFSMIVASVSLMLLVRFLYPAQIDNASVTISDPLNTLDLHNEAVQNTEFWFHHGHFGRWVRAKVFVSFCQQDRGVRRAVLIILDPDNFELCERYATYRNSGTNRRRDKWTADEVRMEVYTTIFQAAKCCAENPSVTIEIYLSGSFSVMRKDVNSKCVFLTSDDPKSSSLVISAGTPLYELTKTDFEIARRECKLVPLKTTESFAGTPSEESIAKVLSHIGPNFPATDRVFVKGILARVLSKKIPYDSRLLAPKY